MVKLEEVEDEFFVEKPATTKDGALLADDDEDYTDTDSEISDASDVGDVDESIFDRIAALKDIIPPQTRSKIASITSSVTSATGTGINYGGKGLWIITTSILLLGLPYALLLGDEQQFQEEEKQRMMMQEGAQGIMNAENSGEARPAL